MRDLGELTGTVLVFGGPYSNLAATEALHQVARDLDLPPERVICTGDVAAYCAEPEGTVRLIRNWGIPVVQGNCELSFGTEAADCGCGFEAGTTCSTLATKWYRYTADRIGPDDRDWMRGLPRSLRFQLAGRSVCIVHGGVTRINRFIFPSTPAAVKREEVDTAGTDILVGGHSGIPSAQRLGQRVWLNAGVIGLPANDGTPDGWYMLLEPEADRIRASWHRLPYDAERSRRNLITAGFPGGYAEALRTGLWPGLEVLPPAERSRQGQALRLESLLIGR